MNARSNEGNRNQTSGQEAERNAIVPPVDIFEDDAGLTLYADLSGVSKDRLGVKVHDDTLVIEGEASVPFPEGMELLYSEMPAPYYRRSFTLSRELDASNIEAKLKDGVLKLRIPKAEEAKPRRIEVRVV
jgi:HSP20 family protein